MKKVILLMASCMCFSVFGMDRDFSITRIDQESKNSYSILKIDKVKNDECAREEAININTSNIVDLFSTDKSKNSNVLMKMTDLYTYPVLESTIETSILKEFSSNDFGGKDNEVIKVINLAPSWWRLETCGGYWSIAFTIPPRIWEHRQFAITPARAYMNWQSFFEWWFGISR